MKQNYKFIIGLFLFLLFVSACTDEQEGISLGKEEVQGITVNLALSSLPLQGSGTVTRSAGTGMDLVLGDDADASTRIVDDSKESDVNDICIFQFAGDSKGSSSAVLISKTYVFDLKSATPATTLPLVLAPFTKCFLYVCANVGDITGEYNVGEVASNYTVGASTFQDMLDGSFKVNAQSDFGEALPMSGCSDLIETNAVPDKIGITLTRMVAKVTFICHLDKLPSGDKFEITGAKLCNVPQKVMYELPLDNTSTVEVTSHVGTVSMDETGKIATCVWYMPENKRGSKDGITSWAERVEKNAPKYSSFIELSGNYTRSGTTTATEVAYSIYLGNGTMSNYDVERNHRYQFTSTIKGVNAADQRVTTECTNLSADGLANCYLAGENNHWYRFNGTVRGNGNTEDYAHQQYGGNLYENASFPSISMMPSKVGNAVDAVTIPIESVAKAGVVWETKKGIITSVRWDSTTGYVRFETGSVLGNALLAVYDEDNHILWSWHIWRTDGVDLAELNRNHVIKFKTNTTYSWYAGETGVYPGYGRKRDLVMMECNIGAHLDKNSNVAITYAGNINEYNIDYQFGRKDPMPAITISSGTWSIVGISSTATGVTNILDYTILNPNKFIISAESIGYNWMRGATINSEEWCVSNCLWGDNNPYGGNKKDLAATLDPVPWGVKTSIPKEANGDKTIYDPSPAGWRVAPADTWSAVTNGVVQNWLSVNAYKSSFANGYTLYFSSDKKVGTFCPASGFRDKGTGGIILLSENGYGWCSSPGGQFVTEAVALAFSSVVVHVPGSDSRAIGFPVRCVK